MFNPSLPKHLQQFLQELGQSPEFQALLSALERPQIPLWRPSSGNDPVEWAYHSGKRDAFDGVLLALGYRPRT